jgi:hypothetical protein
MRTASSLARLFTLPLLTAGVHAELSTIPEVKVDGAPSADQVAFFEKSIRPVLVKNCYECHSAEAKKVKGGLLLDTREGIRAGGDSGHAVVPGSLSESLLIKALHWTDKDTAMPPEKSGGKLPDEVIKDFEKWVLMGAPDPRDGVAKMVSKKEIDWTKAREFWAFKAPQKSPVPAPAAKDWPRADVDRFILAALEEKGLKPVADSDPRALLRRLTFDLVGLPPKPEEIDAFLQSAIRNPQSAIEEVVDRLLASPQFGERWGRHWLDVARFAESTGKERNFTFPEAWRYRDWVIAAVNADKPYDQFIIEQIAGDLLPAKDSAEHDAHLIATGFLALGPKGLNEKNREQFRMDLVDDQIDATSRAVLGLTVACARCHDHKFDPIPQKDYYALAGIFRSTTTYYGTGEGAGAAKNRNAAPLLSLTPPPATDAATPAPAPNAPPPAPVQPSVAATTAPDVPAFIANDPSKRARFLRLPPERRAELLQRFGRSAPATSEPPAPTAPEKIDPPAPDAAAEKKLAAFIGSDPKKAQRFASLSPQQRAEILERLRKGGVGGGAAFGGKTNGRKQMAGMREGAATESSTPETSKAMGAGEGSVANASILIRGEVDHRGDTVPRGFVTVLTSGTPPPMPADKSGRLELAQWLTAPENPLTARVMVNRVWQDLFGQGLVRTPDNFGATGATPSNPALLDHLALQFMRDGWSLKKLVRSIVLSRTYQLSTAHDSADYAADPENTLLWRSSPRRLDAEAIRDAMLAASGQFDLTPLAGSVVARVGDGYIGRGIRPEVFQVESNKRSVYLPIVRDFVPDALEVFDFAEPSLVVAARDVTNVPAQALFLMNDSFVLAQAKAMAKRVLTAPLSDPQRITLAYQLTLSRPPTDSERARADEYLRSEVSQLIPVKNGAVSEAGETPWATFCQALFACAEFRYLK